MLKYFFISMFLSFLFSLFFAVLKKEKISNTFFLLGFAFSIFNIGYIIFKCHRLPTYGKFEITNHIIFISALIEILYKKK